MLGRSLRIRLMYLFLAGTALANSGCLALAIGGIAGGAGMAGHAYMKGKVCELYLADLNNTWAATKTALTADLGMQIEKEQLGPTAGVIHTRTGDGARVRIHVDSEQSRIPAEGPITRVSVRVSTFGDYPLSERILVQIGSHLVAAPASGSGQVIAPPLPPGPTITPAPIGWQGTAPARQAIPPVMGAPQPLPGPQPPTPATPIPSEPPLAPPPRRM